MRQSLISFKGVKEGIFVDFHGDDFEEIKEELFQKLDRDYAFYKDTKLIGIKGDELSSEELLELKLILRYKYDLDVGDLELPKEGVKKEPLKEKEILQEVEVEEEIIEESSKASEEQFEGIQCGMTKFVNGTLRSGRLVEYSGNIVIIGDVNPGALIQANGNIVVLGTLRGVAHAGMDGNLDAVVAAYNLQPTQLRIGNLIARPPDSVESQYKLPEVAKVRDGEVVIDPYLPNK